MLAVGDGTLAADVPHDGGLSVPALVRAKHEDPHPKEPVHALCKFLYSMLTVLVHQFYLKLSRRASAVPGLCELCILVFLRRFILVA